MRESPHSLAPPSSHPCLPERAALESPACKLRSTSRRTSPRWPLSLLPLLLALFFLLFPSLLGRVLTALKARPDLSSRKPSLTASGRMISPRTFHPMNNPPVGTRVPVPLHALGSLKGIWNLSPQHCPRRKLAST